MKTWCKKGKSNIRINKFSYKTDIGKVATKMIKIGMLEGGRIHETADDGIYHIWHGNNRLNRKKEVCFIDTGINYHVRLPRECPDYCRECNRDHGKIQAIPA